MKILLCTTSFQNITNGPTKFANFLFEKGVEGNGIEIHILSEDILKEDKRLYKCQVGFLRKILPLAPIYRMIKYFLKSRKLDKIYKFDYVIYNNAIYGLVHSYFASNIIGMINDDNNQKNKFLNAISTYSATKRFIFKYFEKKAIASSRLILTNSDYLTNFLKDSFPKNSSKIKKLYKGIEIKENLRNNINWDIQETKFIKILFVKNDYIRGGLGVLAESISKFNVPIYLTIVGPPLKYSGQINSLFMSSNVTINFLGQQSQQQVFTLMANHHIFCVPSLQEALGVANMEALNIGIPVVSSDAGGIPEVLDYGNCGFLSKAGNVESLFESLNACIFNKTQREEKVLNGFKHVKKFKADFIMMNLNGILNERI